MLSCCPLEGERPGVVRSGMIRVTLAFFEFGFVGNRTTKRGADRGIGPAGWSKSGGRSTGLAGTSVLEERPVLRGPMVCHLVWARGGRADGDEQLVLEDRWSDTLHGCGACEGGPTAVGARPSPPGIGHPGGKWMA